MSRVNGRSDILTRSGQYFNFEEPGRGRYPMIAGVVLDRWKLAVFKRHLDAAGFKYTEHPGITAGTLTLKVKCEWLHKLQPVMKAAADECRASGPPANGDGDAARQS